ncbi:15-O-acetyltransferase Tri3-domain-containing protein [Mycena galericulata]|nr:15-O-acetyltransferase Tri3-domain-containing protein [Mycena galericulata]
MFVGELLRRVGERWGRWGDADPGPLESDEYKWGEEVTNLSEPMLDACRVDVGALQENSEFIEARDEFIRATVKSGSSWGLPVTNGSDNPRTVFHTFSVSETSAIIRAVKARLGAGHTISHLGHAATALTLIKIRPPPPGATLVSPIPADGRRFLRDGLAARQYGCCQAGAVVDFGPLADWVVEDWSNADAVRAMLAKGCRCVKEGYDYWLQKEFQLPVDASKSSFLADLLSSTTPSFTGSDTPGFASDGVSDRYIPGEVTTPSGEALFTVDNCFFFLDSYSPGLGIRMEGWKGATMLGFCFNDGSFAAEDARAFLEEMAGLMLMFAQ